ncbi:MAG: peptidoglycan-binding domain-containing protein [Gaiellaceae bacterium]
MSGRVNPDDWFAEPERVGQQPVDRGGDDDWLDDRPPVRRVPLAELPWIRPAAIGAGAIVVLLLALWAAGVFSGGSSAPTTPATTATQPAATSTVQAPPPAAVPAPATTLTPGATGAQVKRLQRALAQLGYSPGKVDGSYGPATVSALKQFQQANGLTADGVLGPKTLRELKRLLVAS